MRNFINTAKKHPKLRKESLNSLFSQKAAEIFELMITIFLFTLIISKAHIPLFHYDFIANAVLKSDIFPKDSKNEKSIDLFKKTSNKQQFPPIQPGSIRVFVTACSPKDKIPKFINATVTTARCNIMEGYHCHEVPYMLDFLINWYDNLTEETVVFSHGHTTSWHMPNIVNNLERDRKTEYFRNQSFGGFRHGLWKRCCDDPRYQDIYPFMFQGTTMPRVWTRYSTYPCCSTFFVKTSQIRMRPKQDYINMYKNLQSWVAINPNISFHCGRVFEYTWHVIFTGSQEVKTPSYVRWMVNKKGPCKFNHSDVS